MSNNNAPKLRLMKIQSGDQKLFSIFVALSDRQFANFEDQGARTLVPYQEHILLVVEGHHPSEQDMRDAQMAFNQCYTTTKVKAPPLTM